MNRIIQVRQTSPYPPIWLFNVTKPLTLDITHKLFNSILSYLSHLQAPLTANIFNLIDPSRTYTSGSFESM